MSRDADFEIVTIEKLKFSKRVNVELEKQRNKTKHWGPEVMAERRRISLKETDKRQENREYSRLQRAKEESSRKKVKSITCCIKN